VWPPDGPAPPEQHRWRREFPFAGSGRVNRLCVHDAIVDFAERAMQTADIRLYQAGVAAKYTASPTTSSRCTPTATTRGCRRVVEAPWWHVETFLYLSDVDIDHAPTHLVSVRDAIGRPTTAPLFMPKWDRELYAQSAPPVAGADRCSRTGPTSSIAAVDLTAPDAARFLLNVSYKVRGPGLGRLRLLAVTRQRARLGRVRRGIDPAPLELFRVSRTGPPDLGRGVHRRHGRAVPRRLDLQPMARRALSRVMRSAFGRTRRKRRL